MFAKNLSRLVRSDLESLVKNSVRESRTLEYKQELKQNTPAEKKELLADIASFANSGGGDVVFGIAESDGAATEVCGLHGFGEDHDKLRLESIIRDGIEPRIQGLQLRVIGGFRLGPVLIVRVPRSWVSPHMVAYKGGSRFFTRNSAGKYQMDVSEIRTAFEGSGQLPKRISEWRTERIGRLIADEGVFRIQVAASGMQGFTVLHIVPISTFDAPGSFDMAKLHERPTTFPPMGSSCQYHRINLDGLVTYSSLGSRACLEALSYTQVFRNGALEAVCGGLVTTTGAGAREFTPQAVESSVRAAFTKFLSGYSKFGVEPPLVLMLTLHGVKEARMYRERRNMYTDEPPLRDDTLVLQSELLPSLDKEQIEASLRHVFDLVWNALGHDRSQNDAH